MSKAGDHLHEMCAGMVCSGDGTRINVRRRYRSNTLRRWKRKGNNYMWLIGGSPVAREMGKGGR
jgi:hypothetical protein